MAANEVTKKLRIYHTLYRLNISFSNIIKLCQTLRDEKIFNAKQLKMFQGYAKELQAEINEGTLERLYDIEFNDWTRFGKIRLEEEKRLRARPYFTNAKKRKRKNPQKNKRG